MTTSRGWSKDHSVYEKIKEGVDFNFSICNVNRSGQSPHMQRGYKERDGWQMESRRQVESCLPGRRLSSLRTKPPDR